MTSLSSDPYESPINLPENTVKVGRDGQSAWRVLVNNANGQKEWTPLIDKPKARKRKPAEPKAKGGSSTNETSSSFLSLFQPVEEIKETKPPTKKRITRAPRGKGKRSAGRIIKKDEVIAKSSIDPFVKVEKAEPMLIDSVENTPTTAKKNAMGLNEFTAYFASSSSSL